MNFIDIHCHILPGLDDGPETLEESIEMAKIALHDGISHLFATPHITDGVYENNTRGILNSVGGFKSHLPDGMTLLYGADVRLSIDLIKRIENGDIPTLSNSGYLLIEFPNYSIPPNMDNLIFNLRHRKIIPVITHPERHMLLSNDIKVMKMLKDSCAMFQITAMSITGEFGRQVKKVSLNMIEKGFADFVATDAHDAERRTPILSLAYKEVKKEFGADTADRIFFDNPGKILQEIKHGT